MQVRRETMSVRSFRTVIRNGADKPLPGTLEADKPKESEPAKEAEKDRESIRTYQTWLEEAQKALDEFSA